MSKYYQPLGLGMTPSKTELGKFLRARRLELGLRQIEVAKLSGMKQNYYSGLEIGKPKSLRPKQLNNLSEALQCEPSQLQTWIADKPKIKTELGTLIRARRDQLGLTRRELAEISGIGYSTIDTLENGIKDSFSYGLMKPLAKALGLEPSALTNYVGKSLKTTESKLGQLIRARRKELGISQIQLAERLRVSKQFMSQVELGHCSLNKNRVMVEQLSEALKCHVPVELMPSPKKLGRPKST